MNLGKDNKGVIYISEEARKANLAIFGIKNTGKAYTLIPYLFKQDLQNKNAGTTIVVDTPELAWYLYGMAKLLDRKVDILKPSVNFDLLNNLLFEPEWDYNKIKKIFDYDKAIREKHIVIIDMEQEKYGERSIRAASMLLLQLQSDMVSRRKNGVKHNVYIDSASDYLPYIKNLLKYGDYHDFTTTLFFKSRQLLGEYAYLVDIYVRNLVILQGITWEDAKYFGERLALSGSPYDTALALMGRHYGEFAYEILSQDGFKRKVGYAELVQTPKEEEKRYEEKALFWSKRNKRVSAEDQHLQLETEKNKLSLPSETSYLETIEDDVKKSEAPQLNKIRKTSRVEFEHRTDFSALNEEKPTGVEVELEEPVIEPENIDTSELDIAEPEIEDTPFEPEEEFSPDIEVDLDDDLDDIDIPEPTTFDNATDSTVITLSIGGRKVLPYQKIKNNRIEKALKSLNG